MTVDDAAVVEHLLVLRAQLGARDALSRLVARHDARVLFYLRRLLGRPGPGSTDAEDLRQRVWLSVMRKLGTLEDPAAFRGWLYRIARNEAMSWLRNRSIRLEVPLDLAVLDPVTDDTDDDLGFGPEDAAAMYDALDALSSNHREMLTLRFLGGLSYEEIARVLDCPVGTVRSRIHYAKAALRALLDPAHTRKKGTR